MRALPFGHPLFASALPRLAIALLVLILVARSAREATRRMIGRTPIDVEWCAIAALVAAALVIPAILLGAAFALHDWTWALATLLIAFAMQVWSRTWSGEPRSTTHDEPPSALFVVMLGGFMIGRAVYSLRNPPADWDSIFYHLPMAAYWMQSHTMGVALHDPPAFGTYFPGNGEILQMFAAWAVGRETLMPWMGILGLGVLGLAIRRLSLMVGARGPIAEGIALCIAGGPGLAQLTLGTRIDNLLAAWFTVALLFAVRHRRSQHPGDLTVMLVATGLMAGCKSTGPVYAALLLAVAFARHGALARIPQLIFCRVGLVVAAVLGGFWLLRNGLASGNPIFPAETRIGPWTLPGLLDSETLRRTSQVQVWREGFAGHLTLPNLWDFYGPSLIALAIGLPLLLKPSRSRDEPRAARAAGRTDAWLLLILGLVTFVLFLFAPFSGAYLPATNGQPPPLNIDNMRLLLPSAVALIPVAALGLSRLPMPAFAGLALGLLFLVGIANKLGHVLPGIVLAAVIGVGGMLFGRRLRPPAAVRVPALVILGALGLGLAVAAVEPLRDRVTDKIWDGYIDRIHNLPSATIHEVRTRAGGRPIAVAGLDAWWAYYGRDFGGHPVYVPVGLGGEGFGPYRFLPDRRDRADRERWRTNLERERPAAILLGAPDGRCDRPLPEREWVAADSAGFRAVGSHGCDVAYEARSSLR
jgi:hypothetical protein